MRVKYRWTPAQVERMGRLIEENPDMDVIIAVNQATPALASISQEEANAVEELRQKFHGHVITYDDNDLIAEFPTIVNAKPGFGKITASRWARNYHDECNFVVLKKYQEMVGRQWKGCGVWVVEQDVEYTGKFSEFFYKYTGRADMIGYRHFTHNFSDMIHGVRCSTLAFRSKFVIENRAHGYEEHLSYFSRALLKTFSSEMHEGRHCHSEIGSPTMALVNGFSYQNFDRVDVDVENYSYKAKLGDWRQMKNHVKALRSSGRKLLVHPCKY
mmetsp:Transcript_17482/g.27940  ORF Transcript_17482/g.27940 Transcript_17482/m.27940 type:complete len:271 (+) Transcript_17482:243-1055(+)